VALLTNFIPPYRIPLFRALKEKVRQFDILASTPMEADRPWEPMWQELSVTVQRTITVTQRQPHSLGFNQLAPIHIPYDTLWRLARIRPDAIIAGELGARTLQATLYRFCSSKTRIVIWATLSEVTELARGRIRRLLRSFMLPRADAILVNGTSGERYVRSFGVSEGRIFTAPQTTDMRGFLAIPLGRDKDCQRRILYCGQLIERKGLQFFVRTLGHWAEQYPSEQVEFWLVGDGPLRTQLESSPTPTNLSLKFIGNVAYHELPAWYAQAGILALPTLADEWGLVVNEALASGVPVLGSVYSQAVEELVRDGENGWTFRPERTGEMFAALGRALTTPEPRLNEMRARARRSIEHLTPEFVADRIADAIRFVLANAAPGRKSL